MGSIMAARRAGYRPNATPTTTEIPNAVRMDHGATIGSSAWIVGGRLAQTSGRNCSIAARTASTVGQHRNPIRMPITPPLAESTMVSARNWEMMSFCLAPSARRTPISRVRFGHRRQHDVHDADATHEQRNARDDDQQDVEHHPQHLRLTQQFLGDGHRVVVVLVVLLQQDFDDVRGFFNLADLVHADRDLIQLDDFPFGTAAAVGQNLVADPPAKRVQRDVDVGVVVAAFQTAADRCRRLAALRHTNHQIDVALLIGQ